MASNNIPTSSIAVWLRCDIYTILGTEKKAIGRDSRHHTGLNKRHKQLYMTMGISSNDCANAAAVSGVILMRFPSPSITDPFCVLWLNYIYIYNISLYDIILFSNLPNG